MGVNKVGTLHVKIGQRLLGAISHLIGRRRHESPCSLQVYLQMQGTVTTVVKTARHPDTTEIPAVTRATTC
jgi:hypothetical protein